MKLLDVAYVPGVQFNLFSLLAVMPNSSVTVNAIGAHILRVKLSFVPRDTTSYVEATRGSNRCRRISPGKNEAHGCQRRSRFPRSFPC